MFVRHFSVITVLALLSACSSMRPSECLYGDWYARGQSAAAAGLAVGEIMRYQTQCVRHGIVPNRREFVAGYYSVEPHPSSDDSSKQI